MAVTATLWPILFAAVLGPTLKAAALHYAEHGVKLGVRQSPSLSLLDISSHIADTGIVLHEPNAGKHLLSCVTLRIISMLSIVLVVMWSLSPIGGQGALRALSLTENATSHEYPIMSYPNNNLSAFEGGPFNSGASGGASLINQFRAPIGAVFSTQDIALLHSSNASQAFESTVQRLGGMQEAIKSTQRDLWRNVRIPFLHTLDGYHSHVTEWLPLQNGMIPAYSSLIGVPIRGYPLVRSGNTSFVVKTNYQVLEVILSTSSRGDSMLILLVQSMAQCNRVDKQEQRKSDDCCGRIIRTKHERRHT
jgi:hypothetical protein